MKKLLLLFVAIIVYSATHAAYFTNLPINVKQPDGTVVKAYATGDEFYRRVSDENGYTIIRDTKTGFLVYAILENDELVSSGYFVGKTDPASVNLVKEIDISGGKKELIRQNFLKMAPQKEDLPGYIAPKGAKNAGTINNLVIYIRFSDDPEFTSDPLVYEDLFNKDETGESMYRYFYDVSNGTLSIHSTFYPAPQGSAIVSYQDINPRSYYEGVSNNAAIEHALLKRAVEAVSNQIPTGLNLDFDNDGYVDNICFVIIGDPGPWNSLLWPHRWALYYEYVYIDGKRVWDYNVQIENNLFTASNCRHSVLAHEMFHTLSAPDLYRYNDNTITPVGGWDLMASQTIPPQSTGAFMKFKYGGWIDEIPEITSPGVYTINNIWADSGNCFKIQSPNSASEYFVIEYRDKSVIWDSRLAGSGLIISRINTAVADGNSGGPPDEIYIFRPGGNGATNGTLSNAYFSNQSGRTSFSDTTDPACILAGGSPGLGGIIISDIGNSGGETMSFRVSFPSTGVPVAEDATKLTRTSFAANWNPSVNATGYILNVYYKEAGSPVEVAALKDIAVGDVITYDISNLDRNTSTVWYYTVKAIIGGINTGESNEIEVILPSSDPVICEYPSNILPTDTPGNFSLNLSGQNPDGFTEYAEYYAMSESGKVTGFYMDITATDNNSGNGKITMKLWDVISGKPGTVLYSEDFTFDQLATGEYFDFATPTVVPANFFIGYQVYYETTEDKFAIRVTNARGTGQLDTFYHKSGATWSTYALWSAGGVAMTSSSYMSPQICTSGLTAGFEATGPLFTCDGDKVVVSFTDTSLEDITSWAWDFGDGGTSTSQNPQHTYTTAGEYTVSLTVTNNAGSDTATQDITIWIGGPEVLYDAQDASSATADDGEVTLTVSGAEPLSYLWSDGGTGKDRTGLAPGTYSVTVTDNNGCETTVNNIVISVASSPLTADFDVLGGPSFFTCDADGSVTVTFTDTSSGPIDSYSWNFGDTSTSALQNPQHTYISAGEYAVSLTVSDDLGNSDTATQDITIWIGGPEVSYNVQDASSATGSDGEITLTVSGAEPLSYLWNDGNTGKDRTGLAPGTYSVTVTDNNGCETTIENIVISSPLTADFDAAELSFTCDANGYVNVLFTNTSSGPITSWSWNFGDGNTSTLQNPATHAYASAGEYTVSLTVSDGSGNSDTATRTIYIMIGGPEALYDVQNATSATADDGEIMLTVSGGAGAYSYLWSDGDTGKDRTGLAPGTYSVTITDANGCETMIEDIVVSSPLVADFEATGPFFTCDANGYVTVTFDNTSSGPITSWSWNFGDGGTSVSQNPTRTYDSAGEYSVSLTVSDGSGNSDTATRTIYIMIGGPEALYDVQNATSAIADDGEITLTVSGGAGAYSYLWNDGDTGKDRTGLAPGTYSVTITDANGCETTIEDIVVDYDEFSSLITSEAGLKIYPNPAKTWLTVETGKPLSIRICSLSGVVLFEQDITGTSMLNVEKFTPGVYVIIIRDRENNSEYRKLIIE